MLNFGYQSTDSPFPIVPDRGFTRIDFKKMRIDKGLMVAVVAAILTSGCAALPPGGPQDINDPFEPVNRLTFDTTLAVDKGVFRPTAIAYRRIVPEPLRDSVRNFLNNLDSPIILANDVLQGETNRAGITLIRAGVNTTFGLGGLLDVASRWGYMRHYEDFGQTLAVWGVGEGPYLFVPLLGPGNPRDVIGWIADLAFDPFTYLQWPHKFEWQAGKWGIDYVDLRARNIETLDDLEKTSLDLYASLRSLYRQSRNNEIRNGAPEVQDLPDF